MTASARRPNRLPPTAALPLAVAAISAALVPGCPAWGALTVLAAIALRLLSDRRGVETLTPGVAASLRALLPFGVAIGLIAAQPDASEGAGAFLSVCFAVEGLTLVSPAGAWSRALLLGLSAAEIAAVSMRLDGPMAVGPVLAYAAALVGTLATLEREASPLGVAERDAGTRRVTAAVPAGLSRRPALRATVRLLALGLPFGFLLFCALPPSPAARAAAARRDARDAARREAAYSSRGSSDGAGAEGGEANGSEPGSADPGTDWRTGARTRMRLGFVERIKNDPTKMLMVRFAEGDRGPPALRLRGLAYDAFTGTEWQRSPAASREARSLDGAAGAWQALSTDPVARSLRRVTITDLAGQPEGPLFLVAEPERIRLTDSAEEAHPALAVDGTVYARGPLPAGAVYEEDARDAGFDPAAVKAAASTAGSSPILSYARPPPDRAEYLRLALEAVGTETRPAARAERITTWLKRRCAYSLSLPQLDRRRPVLDFLLRAKQGPCEYFASALTLMLRSLGHPARYVVGVRGGAWLEEEKAWLFRGTNAHGWTELWLDGLGWQAYDPTPPDESAVDFDPEAAAAASGEAQGGEGGRSWLENLMGWGRGRPGFLRDVREGTASFFASIPLAFRYAIPAALLLAFVLLLRRSRRSGALVAAGATTSHGDLGAYGRALHALRDAGIVRMGRDTPAEFLAVAARALPPAEAPFSSLTRRFEEQRYGQVPPTSEEVRRMDEEARRVREAVAVRRHPQTLR